MKRLQIAALMAALTRGAISLPATKADQHKAPLKVPFDQAFAPKKSKRRKRRKGQSHDLNSISATTTRIY
jgi:hypothetical protein